MIRRFSDEHGWLSNFHPCTVPFDGDVYPSAEHAYQAAKLEDRSERWRVKWTDTPGQAKRAGQRLVLRPDWERVKKRVMLTVLLGKFSSSSELAELLCQTMPHQLVEGNTWHDNYWGDCECGRPACALPGENNLGKLLQVIRFTLR
jgi:ribA/ribD-fused uncharacterized protein